VQDRESSPAETSVLTTMLRRQLYALCVVLNSGKVQRQSYCSGCPCSSWNRVWLCQQG